MVRIRLVTQRQRTGKIYYYAQAYDPERSPARKSVALGTTHKAVAEKRLRELLVQVDNGRDLWKERAPARALEELRDEFLTDCRSRGLRPATITAYEQAIRQFMSEAGARTPITGIDAATIRRFCIGGGKLAESSRHHRFRHIRALFSYAVGAGLLEKNPCAEVRLPRAKTVLPALLTLEDVKRILTAYNFDVESGREGRRWFRPFVLTTLFHGLRRGEAIRLRWEDVDFENGRLLIRGSKSGDRLLPLQQPDVLLAWREASGRDSGPVFTGENGGLLNPSFTAKVFREYARLARVKVTKLHGLRHGAATAMLAAGAPTRIVQQIMGHSSVMQSENYMHLVEPAMREAMEKAFKWI